MISSSPSLEVVGFGCFGKLPISREFIVEGSVSLAESGFDRWIGEGVGLAKARLGPRFKERISTFPRYRFFWDGGDDHKLAGVVCPSEDASGRKHPFAFFAHLRGKRISALSSALQVWSLQERTADLLEIVSAAESPKALRETVRSMRLEQPPSKAIVEDQYQRFLQERLGDAFWRNLNGSDGDDRRFTVFQALLETLTPLRKEKDRFFRGGIRYPLPRGSSTETALDSCFWLDITERCLGRALGNTWWLRSPGNKEEDNRYQFLFLSPPGGTQWASLVDPADALDSISYLDRPFGIDPPEDRMDPNLRAILESKDSTLSDYLHWVSGP